MTSSLRNLARFAVELTPEKTPAEVRTTAAMRILDTVSAGIGAAVNPQIKNICAAYSPLSGCKAGVLSDCDASAPVWGQGLQAPLFTAVFLNGLQGHTLELDDVHTKSKSHIGTVVIPAAWSCAAMLGSSGEELITAVIAGYEITARIAMAFGIKEHRKLGWHSTATAGVFGAAAACGKLLGLDEDRMVYALGLAGAQSFGTWAFLADGASCKVLNPARSAQSGCEAAFLAKAGMTGPEHVLTSEDGGLLHMMSTAPVPEYVDAQLGQAWEICEMDNKPYPCCRSTHCAIDAALALRAEAGLKPEDVESISVETYLIGKQQCASSDSSICPHTPPQARFSTPYCVAAALLNGKIGLPEFDEIMINSPAAQELLRKVDVSACERFTAAYPQHWGCHMTVHCTDGRVLEKEIPDASGSVSRPLTAEQAQAKAMGLLIPVIGESDATKLVDALTHLDSAAQLPDLSF